MKRLLIVTLALLALPASANDVQPRLFSNVPVDMNFANISYSQSRGAVSFDSSIPVADVIGEVDMAIAAYSRGLKLGNTSGLLTVAVPWGDLGFSGLYLGEPARADRRGFGDAVIRLGINLIGAPPTVTRDFASYRQGLIVGISFEAVLPTGQYDPTRVINLGANRWSLLPQLGASWQRGRWTFEAALGREWFTANDDTASGTRIQQRPVSLARGTVIYTPAPGWRIGAGYIFTSGGETLRDGILTTVSQENVRTGAWINIPLARQHQLSVVVTEGVVNRIGADFTTWSLGYTYQF